MPEVKLNEDPTANDDINLEGYRDVGATDVDDTLEEEELKDNEPQDDKKEEKEEDKPKVDWESDENPYKKRYGDSSREIQTKYLPQSEQMEKLQKEHTELLDKLKADKPEEFDRIQLEKQLRENTEKLALITEKSNLDGFVGENPLAKPFRTQLQTLARTFPDKSLQELYDENYKVVAEAKKDTADTEKEKKKASQGDNGKGGSTKEPIAGDEIVPGYTLDKFNELPIAKRRSLALKHGLKF